MQRLPRRVQIQVIIGEAGMDARVKLGQNGIVSFPIKLAVFWPAARLYETTCEYNSEPQNNEYRTAEFRRVVSLRSIFF